MQISLWVLWGVLLAFLLWWRFPGFARYAQEQSQAKEKTADKLLEQRPGDSLLLYNEALQWALEPEHEASINRKIAAVNSLFSGESEDRKAVKEETMAISPTGTVMIGEGDAAPETRPVGERYQIQRRLGEGAMGVVYLANDQRMDREVAIKQLSPSLLGDKELMARFRQEARALARLVHPNIVQAFDFIEEGHQAWITMEYVEGQELNELLTDQPMAVEETLDLTRQVASAMAYAHEQGVVHRDLKPANILVTANGSIKIMDFGVAKLNESSMLTRVGTIMGSPAFMSPEQASGHEVGDSTDIYALGIMLYRMLTGHYPFTGDAKSIIAQHLTKVPEPVGNFRPDVPDELAALISSMLEKNPDDRPKSMGDIVKQLNQE